MPRILLVLSLSVILVASAVSIVQAGTVWEAVRVEHGPQLAGDLSHPLWEGARAVTLTMDSPGASQLFVDTSLGPEELTSGDFYLLWDEENLYVGARVSAAPFDFPNWLGSPLNNQDIVQLCVDPLMTRRTDVQDAFIIDLSASSIEVDLEPIWYEHWQHGYPPDGIEMAATVDEDAGVYIIEAAISWDLFMGWVEPEPGVEMGFGVIILNSMGPGGPFELITSYGGGENVIGSPSHWDTLTLVE